MHKQPITCGAFEADRFILLGSFARLLSSRVRRRPGRPGHGGDAGDTLAAAAEITLIEGVLEGEGWLDEDDVADAYHLEVGFHKQVTVARESPEGDNYDLDLHGRYRDLEESSTKPGRWRSRF